VIPITSPPTRVGGVFELNSNPVWSRDRDFSADQSRIGTLLSFAESFSLKGFPRHMRCIGWLEKPLKRKTTQNEPKRKKSHYGTDV
jgi:hypothetical protein